MSKYNYKFIGWSTENGSDKVWGVIFLENPAPYPNFTYSNVKCVTFWGKRGKKFQSKLSYDDYKMMKLISDKIDKGYQQVDKNHLDNVYPEFEKDLDKLAFWSTLKY